MATYCIMIDIDFSEKLFFNLLTWCVFSSDQLFVGTDMQVVRLPVANCSHYGSCEDCLGARDPYCGWCSHDRKYEPSSLYTFS